MHCGQWVQSIGMKTGSLQRSVGIFGRSDPLIHMLGAASIAEHCSQIRECVSDFELTTLDCPLRLAHEPVLPFRVTVDWNISYVFVRPATSAIMPRCRNRTQCFLVILFQMFRLFLFILKWPLILLKQLSTSENLDNTGV